MLAVAPDAEDDRVDAPLVVEAAVGGAVLAQEVAAVALIPRGPLQPPYLGAAGSAWCGGSAWPTTGVTPGSQNSARYAVISAADLPFRSASSGGYRMSSQASA